MRKFVPLTKTVGAGAVALALAAGWTVATLAQQTALPLDPQRERGQSISPAYEGWYPNPDGSFTFLLGYYNRNLRQTLDIPVGPNNKIEPGPADQGQPTHFQVGRQWGVLTIKVPKDFGNKTLTWTIVANGEKVSIPFTLNKSYTVAPFEEIGMGNEPPKLAFAQGGTKFAGPPVGFASTYTAKAGQPLALNIWVEDPKEKKEGGRGGRGSATVANVSLHKYRGPGTVTFDRPRIPVRTQGEMITVNTTFSAPGEYVVRVQANDESGEGGGGFQCCWTNTHLKVAVQ
jgi:hypothetical protein